MTATFSDSPTVASATELTHYRAQIWTDTDPARTGTPNFVFQNSMGFERWTDYLLNMPMYFVKREGRYIDASGQSFRDLLNGHLPALPGERPRMSDWEDHITTAFPEVRLKRYLEMRGADGSRWCHLCALPALWVGLLYDETALSAAWDLARPWTEEDRTALAHVARRDGLAESFRCRSLRDIAAEGLRRRARLNTEGEDERRFLNVLHTMVETGRTQADELLDLYYGGWRQSVDTAFATFSY